MSFRFMRVIVFFDLPVLTSANQKDYRIFRKSLMKAGFIMEQESVYSKLAQNSTVADSIIANVKKNKPPEGLIQILKVTEKQYNKMELVVGTRKRDIIDSDERLIIL